MRFMSRLFVYTFFAFKMRTEVSIERYSSHMYSSNATGLAGQHEGEKQRIGLSRSAFMEEQRNYHRLCFPPSFDRHLEI
jgi:hypothetical protein